MLPQWKIREIIALLQRRYPGWQDFSQPDFVADEIAPKRAAAARAADILSLPALDQLLTGGAYDEVIDRLHKLSHGNHLLWRAAPSAGDTAVLYHPSLAAPSFCLQLRNLLYGDRPLPQRLQTFADFLAAQNLPNKWSFATYYLFLCHPREALFVKPRTARWFLQFAQAADPDDPGPAPGIVLPQQPEAASYARLLQVAADWREALRPFGAQDMIDVQSAAWVCEQASREQTGRLSLRGQVELDVPQATPAYPLHERLAAPAALGEPASRTAYGGESGESDEPDNADDAPYSLAACAADTGVAEAELAGWLRSLARKGQVILFGPPGTGKTFIAQKLARHLASQGDGFWHLLQFHPAFAYEEFVQGLRPITDAEGHAGYQMQPGRFLQFCREARRRQGTCVLIIDEINRANLASVLGELMYLLEYRDAEVALAGGGRFSIPANVRLIGTMNTADRSIALVDYALRRRFAFIELAPNYELLRRYHQRTGYQPDALITLLQQINAHIDDRHFYLGVTFFLQPDLAQNLADIWQTEIEPYLAEYFFDRPDTVEPFRWSQVRRQIAGPSAGSKS